jgi:hypothetical protein
MKGFSVSNLKYCKQVYLFQTQESTFSHQVGGQFLHNFLRNPWRHHIEIVAHSKTIEEALSANVINFLMELGSGFAFVGRQYPIEIDSESYRIDLLFYHLKLRSYVVIDFQIGKFNK